MPKTLTDERYAPITSGIGIISAGIDEVLWQLRTWRESLGRRITVTQAGEFPQALHALEPLEAPLIRRELLVSTANGWTAYFNCFVSGTDAFGPTNMLATLCGCRTFQVTAVTQGGRHYGCVRLAVFEPDAPNPLSVRREVVCMNDGGRWIFEEVGEPFDFEEVERYGLRRKRDRFTTEMLDAYCRALGICPLDEDFYSGPALLLTNTFPPDEESSASLGRRRSLAEAQTQLGFR